MSTMIPPGSFRTCPLGDVIQLQRGFDLPNRDRKAGDIPIVSSSGITGYHDTPRAPGPGVVTGRYGTLGEVFFVREPFWPLNTALYVRDFKGNEPRYVAYLLMTLGLGHQNGAGAVPGVNRNVLHKVPVLLPDVPTQRRIAEILSAYDDAIENNRRRMALLEESVRLLFREWFERLRFRGHDLTKIVDGLPDGWARATLGDLVTLGSGGTPSMKHPDFWGGDVPWISAKDMHGPRFWDSELRLTERALDAGASTAGPDDILILVRGMRLAKELPFGRPMRPLAYNQDVKAIRCGERVLPDFLYQTLVANTATLLAAVDEAAHGTKRLQTPQLLGLPVLLPPLEVQARFADEVAPVNRLLANLDGQNQRLAAARDALLPRLMNGSIAV